MPNLILVAVTLMSLTLAPAAWAGVLNSPKEPHMKLPVILPQISLVVRDGGGFEFEFNNCDGGYWETVAFKGKGDEILFVTFSTPTISNAPPEQVAFGILRGNRRLTSGCRASLTLKYSNTGAQRGTARVHGTVSQSEGDFAEDSNGNCHREGKTETIDLKNVPYSQSTPDRYEALLSDLRSLPGLKNVKLAKMCN